MRYFLLHAILFYQLDLTQSYMLSEKIFQYMFLYDLLLKINYLKAIFAVAKSKEVI